MSKLATATFTRAIFSPVTIKLLLTSILPLTLVLTSAFCVNIPLILDVPTNVPTPTLAADPIALISATPACTTPPTSAMAASAMAE